MTARVWRALLPENAKGLATSSQNARKHGANAKHLVDADEIALYENMMVSLKEKYPSDNPLVGMQLARIAKLNVQLTRIQQFIDAADLGFCELFHFTCAAARTCNAWKAGGSIKKD